MPSELARQQFAPELAHLLDLREKLDPAVSRQVKKTSYSLSNVIRTSTVTSSRRSTIAHGKLREGGSPSASSNRGLTASRFVASLPTSLHRMTILSLTLSVASASEWVIDATGSRYPSNSRRGDASDAVCNARTYESAPFARPLILETLGRRATHSERVPSRRSKVAEARVRRSHRFEAEH